MKTNVEYHGPFRHHDITVDEHRVPFLHASLPTEGEVHLVLDRRFGLELSVEEAERVVPFLAQVVAVAMGYACHPRGDEEARKRPPFPRVREITAVQTTEDAK